MRFCDPTDPLYGEPKTNHEERPDCAYCGKSAADDGHDPCIRKLPGVVFACCGHGLAVGHAYVMKADRSCVRGLEALQLMRDLGGDPPKPA